MDEENFFLHSIKKGAGSYTRRTYPQGSEKSLFGTFDGVGGTNGCTATAINALIAVDNPLAFSFADSADGAFRFTGSAVDAIFSDRMGHGSHSFLELESRLS